MEKVNNDDDIASDEGALVEHHKIEIVEWNGPDDAEIENSSSLVSKDYYGRYNVLYTYGKFPLAVFSMNWRSPGLILAALIAIRAISGIIIPQVFVDEKLIESISITSLNLSLFAGVLFLFSNPGIAGYELGNSKRINTASE